VFGIGQVADIRIQPTILRYIVTAPCRSTIDTRAYGRNVVGRLTEESD
jgi:hypothetical protein